MGQLEDLLVERLLVGAHAQGILLLLDLPSEEGCVVVQLLLESILLRFFLAFKFLSVLSPQLGLLSQHILVNLLANLSLLDLLFQHLTHLCLSLGMSLLSTLVFEHVVHLFLLDVVIQLLFLLVTAFLLLDDHIISHSIHVLLHFGSTFIEFIDLVLFLLIKDFQVCFLSFNVSQSLLLSSLILLSLSQLVLSENFVHEISLLLFFLEVVFSLLLDFCLQLGDLLSL